MQPDEPFVTCPLCGQTHAAPFLKPGQRASCVRCGSLLAEAGHLGPQAPLVFACTGLVLAVPALLLPFVTLSKFGKERTVLLTDGFLGFWTHGFAPFGAAVLIAGTIAPFGLLGLLAALYVLGKRNPAPALLPRLRHWAHQVEYWAMPEVQILGVLVAFFKLGSVVNVTIGPGLYCYGGSSLFTLMAWRSFKLRPRERRPFRAAAVATS
ncbi:MAG: Paraquat-inducible protein [Verrucomicrobia bacterium]|nr:Paraquat-inducible protein [Verrucomicrobiota bacterium]